MELSVSKMLTILSPAFFCTPITKALLEPSLITLLIGSSPANSFSAAEYPRITTGTDDSVSFIEKYLPDSSSTFDT
ncbi:hypothetical protein SDC9_157195 [bioreactor metagenome]|uniref:Uncharacterized protein n=1 Tax=bioreactor metagenome TaxID=1076179 RepID=A0A645F8M6_9ZZZZ